MAQSSVAKAEESLDELFAYDAFFDAEDSCSLLEMDGNVALAVPSKRPRFSSPADSLHAGSSHWGQDDKPLLERLPPLPLGHQTIKQEVDGTEIEPLPDACFGLLGTTCWDVPRGHVDQLPDEVLRQIFVLVPAVDLFRGLSLVCRRWQRVISDLQFIPWKKLYHRYLKAEAQALLTVKGILHQYGITQDENQCLLGFIRYVAASGSRRGHDCQAILCCLRAHPLFAKAEICVAKRLPDLESTKEGMPNVWAVTAAIVLFSGGTGDIQKLVSCLQRPSCTLSLMEIIEALYCMATLLYAMRENGVQVSNRIHYSVFYCLCLLENSSCYTIVPKPEISSNQPAIQPTCEQLQILNHAIAPKEVVKIIAFAGTGKTTTLAQYAEKWSNLRFLYIAFNKTIAEQGRRSFPHNVTCKTIHSLAFENMGKHYSKKLNFGSLSSYWVSFVLQNREGQSLFIRAKTVTRTLATFFASADASIHLEHVPVWCKNTKGEQVPIQAAEKRIVIKEANQIWDNMKNLRPVEQLAYKMTHDGYLKLWQLSKPSLSDYDAIFVDEAQDCTPAIMDIILSQPCGVILVGDPHQQIYTFRGAVNALAEVPHTHAFYLTQSFRFGPEIAYVAASILDICKKVRNKLLVGSNQQGDISGRGAKGQMALLSRNNLTVFEDAVKFATGESPAKIHLIGGLKAFGLDKIHDIWKLLHPKSGLEVQDSFFKRWTHKGFAELKNYAVSAEDKQLEMKIAIVEKYRERIPELVGVITQQHELAPETADYILGTVHKAKGMEFDTVQVANDFVNVPFACHNLRRMPAFKLEDTPDDEWNLLYVAVTRAKRCLILPRCLMYLLSLAGEYYLRPELTTEAYKEGPLWCSVRGCCNAIPAEAPLTMKKLPFVFSDSTKDPEGYLCHACVEQRLGPLVWLTASPEVVGAMEPTEEIVEMPLNVNILFQQL